MESPVHKRQARLSSPRPLSSQSPFTSPSESCQLAPSPPTSSRAFYCILLFFVTASFLLYASLPASSFDIRFPRSPQDVEELSLALRKYREANEVLILSALCTAYLFMQTFCIPGSTFLNLVLGATYSTPFAAFVAISCATLGACSCFLLSKCTARASVVSIIKFFRGEHLLQSLNSAIVDNSDDLLFYFTCIRVSPLFPNWFINLCAPLTSIPLRVFALGSCIGLVPASVLGAVAGKELADLGANGAQLHTQIFKIMVAVGSLAVLPAIAKGIMVRRERQRALQSRFKTADTR